MKKKKHPFHFLRELQYKQIKNQMNFYPRIVFIGEPGSGKTTLISRVLYCILYDEENDFEMEDIGTTICSATYRIPFYNSAGSKSYYFLWDTSSEGDSYYMLPLYLKNASCVVIVVDASSEKIEIQEEKYLKIIRNTCGNNVPVIIALTKCDLIDIDRLRGEIIHNKEIKQKDICYLSAKNGQNVMILTKQIANYIDKLESENIITKNEKKINKKCLII